MTDHKAYIGDGVYVEFDGYHLVLTTEGNVIYLEPGLLEQIVEYQERLKTIVHQSLKTEAE